MLTPQTSHQQTTAKQLGELSLAAPHVVAHRMTRMWMAGPVLSEHDREEFTGMVMEKQDAFTQSWMAMFAEAARIQQQMLQSFVASAPTLWCANPFTFWMELATHHQDSAHRVFNKGLAPVHRAAVENAKRLSLVASNQQTY